jgi:AcrR family transcriptional regulator
MNERSFIMKKNNIINKKKPLRSNSKTKIIETSLELFARFGYEKTSIRMIAEEAGISLGLLYNYFKSKEELLQSIFEQGMMDIDASFKGENKSISPYENMEILIRNIFSIIKDHAEFWRLFYSLRIQPFVLESLSKQIKEISSSLNHKFVEHFTTIGSADPESEARIFIATIDGISIHYVIEPNTYPLDRVVDLLLNQYANPNKK